VQEELILRLQIGSKNWQVVYIVNTSPLRENIDTWEKIEGIIFRSLYPIALK
jgi:hypothetical protein